MNDQPGIFTGERLVADDPLFAADLSRHIVAYRYAQERVRGKSVLDAGCGDGYGTDLLAQTAARAVGVDRNEDTIAVAARRYRRPNLSYRVCDLGALAGLGERFDFVCNFQVIEHLHEPMPFLRQVGAALNPGGSFILTTPNRLKTLVEIPYHVHEYTGDELRSLLGEVFARVEMRGVRADEIATAYEQARAKHAGRILRLDPLGLRRFIPQALIELVYPHLARFVRRGIARDDAATVRVQAENFSISDDYDECVDLLAVCTV